MLDRRMIILLLSKITFGFLFFHSIVTSKSFVFANEEFETITIKLPRTRTEELTHAICAIGMDNIFAIGTFRNNDTGSDETSVTYEVEDTFYSGIKGWRNRPYTLDGVEGSPCAGGMYLRPNNHRGIVIGTEITVMIEKRVSAKATMCVMLDDPNCAICPGDGGFPTSLPSIGFVKDKYEGIQAERGSLTKNVLYCLNYLSNDEIEINEDIYVAYDGMCVRVRLIPNSSLVGNKNDPDCLYTPPTSTNIPPTNYRRKMTLISKFEERIGNTAYFKRPKSRINKMGADIDLWNGNITFLDIDGISDPIVTAQEKFPNREFVVEISL